MVTAVTVSCGTPSGEAPVARGSELVGGAAQFYHHLTHPLRCTFLYAVDGLVWN